MFTKGLRKTALALAALLLLTTSFGAAWAEEAKAFSEWLVSFEDGSGSAEPSAEPEGEATSFGRLLAESEAVESTPAEPEGEATSFGRLLAESEAAEPTPAEPEGEATSFGRLLAEPEAAEPAPAEPEGEATSFDRLLGEPEAAEPAPAGPEGETTSFGRLLAEPEAAPVPALPEAIELPMEGAFAAAPTLEPPQPLRRARIRAVGDLMVHKKQLSVARQSDGSYDFHSQYALIADSLADADYTIANLETTIGKYRNMDYSGFPMFNTPESLLAAVKDAGIDFLTLANNHMLDRYFEGMVNTVDNVEKYGFDFGGANRSPEERDAAKVVWVNGIGIGFLCYTEMTNGMEAYCNSAATEYGVNYLRKADFAADVQKLRDAGADVVIALPHWGEEYKRKPEANTVALAKLLIASGVDVILGSHPHMVQPVQFEEAETADGGTRTGLVAYSLGNFISNMVVQYTDSGIILDFTIQERQDGTFAIDAVRCVPVYCWRTLDGVQAISSLKYLNEKPEIMDSTTFFRMQQSYWELRELLDDSIVMLQE